MHPFRVIPTILLSGHGMVKTKKFRNECYIGDPINAVKIFNEKEVDELILQDISVRRDRRPIQFDWIEEIVTEAFMPIGYGGGINTVEDIRRLLDIGIEKVVLNSLAGKHSGVVEEAVRQFGSQSIVASVDVKKGLFHGEKVVIECGNNVIGGSVESYVARLQDMGVGEIILTSVDKEGTMAGYDLELVDKIANQLDIPVVANGGAGKLEDMRLAKQAGASAASAGSLFVFHGKLRAVLISYPSQAEINEILGK